MLPKRKLESEPVTKPFARAGVAHPNEGDDEQRAIDSFAAILRILGRYAVPQNQMSAEETNLLCEKWARHILVVGARPSDPGDAKGSERRDWAGVTDFVTKLRRTESETVAEYLTSLRETITEFAGGLGTIVSEDGRVEKQLQAQVARLRAAAASSDLQTLKQEALSVSGAIGTVIEDRKRSQQAAMKELGAKVRELSQDLDDARREGAQDALTKVFNRRAFDEYLAKVVALDGVFGRPTSLFMIDIDHFKRVNDTFGHPTGDDVLKKLGDALTRTFPRKTDFVARYGGEEFAVILRDTRLQDTPAVTTRLLAAARAIAIAREGGWKITISVGVSQLGPGEATADWIGRADRALYEAKHGGRNRVVTAG